MSAVLSLCGIHLTPLPNYFLSTSFLKIGTRWMRLIRVEQKPISVSSAGLKLLPPRIHPFLCIVSRDITPSVLTTKTEQVYGDPQEHPQRETYWGHVNPIGPRACYDEGKRVAETMMYAYEAQVGDRCNEGRRWCHSLFCSQCCFLSGFLRLGKALLRMGRFERKWGEERVAPKRKNIPELPRMIWCFCSRMVAGAVFF